MPVQLKCPYCKKMQAGRNMLYTHLTAEHLLYRRHTCANCDFYNVNSTVMTQHSVEKKHIVRLNVIGEDPEKELMLKLAIKLSKKTVGSIGEQPAAQAAMSAVKVEGVANEDSEENKEKKKAGPDEQLEMPSTSTSMAIDKEMEDAGSEDEQLLTCHHQGCNYKVDRAEKSAKRLLAIKKQHVEQAHGGQQLFCPVEDCPRAKKRFACLVYLTSHISSGHEGVDSLTEEQHDKYEEMKEDVKKLYKDQLHVCFPESDEED